MLGVGVTHLVGEACKYVLVRLAVRMVQWGCLAAAAGT